MPFIYMCKERGFGIRTERVGGGGEEERVRVGSLGREGERDCGDAAGAEGRR